MRRIVIGIALGGAIGLVEYFLFFATLGNELNGKVLGVSGVIFCLALIGFIACVKGIVPHKIVAGVCIGCLVSSAFFLVDAANTLSKGG